MRARVLTFHYQYTNNTMLNLRHRAKLIAYWLAITSFNVCPIEVRTLGCPYLHLHYVTEQVICPIELHGVKIDQNFFLTKSENF